MVKQKEQKPALSFLVFRYRRIILKLIEQLPACGIDKCLHRVRVEGYAALFEKIQRVCILRFFVYQPCPLGFLGRLNREFYPADDLPLVTLRDLFGDQRFQLRYYKYRQHREDQLDYQFQNYRYIHLFLPLYFQLF